MRFKAHYLEQLPVDGKRHDKWKTIDADTLNEADAIARKWRPNGYIVGAIIQDYTHAD